MKSNRVVWDSLLTALAPAIWGSTYLVTTELLPADSPMLASVIRALPAGILLMIIGGKLPQGVWWLRALVLGCLNIGAFFYFLFVAAYHLPGGVAAMVMSSQPVMVLLLGVVILKQKVLKAQVLACVVGAAGVGLLVLQPSASLDMVGVLAGLAGALSMATGIVLTKLWGRPDGVSVLNFTGWQLAIGGLVLVPIALMTEQMPEQITAQNWLGFAYLSIVGALFAYIIWFRGLERLPAITVSFISFASPLAATVLGFVVLGQGLDLMQTLGALAIVASIILVQPRQPKPQPEVKSHKEKVAVKDPLPELAKT